MSAGIMKEIRRQASAIRQHPVRRRKKAAGMRADPAGMVARVGRHWGWVLAFGIITLLIGIAALAWPGRTLVVIAVLFGSQLVVMGICRFAGAFASDDLTGGRRV